MTSPFGGGHTEKQYEKMRGQRRKLEAAGKMVRLRGCHVPNNYDNDVLEKVSYDQWEVACDEAPYPLLCINCQAVINGTMCSSKRKAYRSGIGTVHGREIATFTIRITGCDSHKLHYEVMYEDDERAGDTHGIETFERWMGQHGGEAPKNRNFHHQMRG